MLRFFFCSPLLLVVPLLATAQELPPALPLKHAPQPTVADITAGDLMTRLYIFADDSMQGRLTGTVGNWMGTEYIATEAKRMGLQPAGQNGTYFQNVPGFPVKLIAKTATFRIGDKALKLADDFIPIGSQDLDQQNLGVVYGGPIQAPTVTAAQVAGKLVVFSISEKKAVDSMKIPDVAAGATAIGVVALDSVRPYIRGELVSSNTMLLLSQDPGKPVVLLSDAVAQQLFGKSLASVPGGTEGQNVTSQFAFRGMARNVVAIIPGSDPVLRHQYVALGAHNDHIGQAEQSSGDHDSLRVLFNLGQNASAEQINTDLAKLRKLNPPRRDSIFNGADDDGSGSVTLLEIAQHIAAMPVKPKRSILFVWHAGEEEGMLGSAYFTSHSTVPRDSIVTHLNADMVGRGSASDRSDGGPGYINLIGARNLSTQLGALIDTVNAKGHYNFKFDEVDPADFYHRSDHFMYAQYNIPIAFFITGEHPDYHQITDEPQYIDYEKMARVGQLIDGVAVHVANLDHRPVVDKK